MRGLILAVVAFLAMTFGAVTGHAQPTYVGADKCGKCHKASYDVWKGTKHHSSSGSLHPEIRHGSSRGGMNKSCPITVKSSAFLTKRSDDETT